MAPSIGSSTNPQVIHFYFLHQFGAFACFPVLTALARGKCAHWSGTQAHTFALCHKQIHRAKCSERIYSILFITEIIHYWHFGGALIGICLIVEVCLCFAAPLVWTGSQLERKLGCGWWDGLWAGPFTVITEPKCLLKYCGTLMHFSWFFYVGSTMDQLSIGP